MVDAQANDVSASVPAKAAPVAVAGDDAAPALPFDPSLITEGDEPPEMIAELDVPELPAEEPKPATPYRADYELDRKRKRLSSSLSYAPLHPSSACKKKKP